jgi:methylase of polypeptide subunit release factors
LSSEPFDPIADLEAATALGDALRAVGYDEQGIVELLGDDGPGTDETEVPVHERRLDGSPRAAIIRLCLLQLPVPVATVGREVAEAFAAIGLGATDGGVVRPRARIMPAEGLLLAFDGFARGEEDPPGYVAPYTPTASWLAALTPRRRTSRALDVGTGNGIQALLAARHSEHVVATDVNPRALAFTEINAALNGLENVETRLGSLFEPVAGERFDLIACNAPYVVSPESKWQYRDGGLPADELSQRVVTEAAAALDDDGLAALLVSWVAASEDAPDVRLASWLDGTGCDAWVLELMGADPLEHAAGWNEHLSQDPVQYGEALDEWLAYFTRLGVGWITEGAVLLHRRPGDRHVLRIDSADPDDVERASAQIKRAFASHARLAELGGRQALLDARLALAPKVRVDQILEPGADEPEVRLVLEEGTHVEYELDPDVAEVVKALNGQRTLGRAIDRVVRIFELDKSEAAELRRDTLDETEDLLALGLAELRPT